MFTSNACSVSSTGYFWLYFLNVSLLLNKTAHSIHNECLFMFGFQIIQNGAMAAILIDRSPMAAHVI